MKLLHRFDEGKFTKMSFKNLRYGAQRSVSKIVYKNRSIVITNKTLQNCVKQGSVYFLLCPNQGPKIEGVCYTGCIF